MGPHHNLAEQGDWYIISEYEVVYLISHSKKVVAGDFYGDPRCAVIDADEKWCAIGGCGLIIYWLREPFRSYEYDVACSQWGEFGRDPQNTWWITRIEQAGPELIRFWVDEESSHKGCYEMSVRLMQPKNTT